eukprot:TRINITY_DN2156_c2_g1_i2.p6 TRINITY_DN2156_c2_g1~~TRINITY_DN2156_c2_g1_i2.p6  ORF type:complete len:119 (-),score=1.16 TRINITY_DN2156_c2_g1_i2:1295-1651(-)
MWCCKTMYLQTKNVAIRSTSKAPRLRLFKLNCATSFSQPQTKSKQDKERTQTLMELFNLSDRENLIHNSFYMPYSSWEASDPNTESIIQRQIQEPNKFEKAQEQDTRKNEQDNNNGTC